MRKALDDGKDLGMPDGVLINGKGPYRYNDTLVPDNIDFEQIDVKPGNFLKYKLNLNSLIFLVIYFSNTDMDVFCLVLCLIINTREVPCVTTKK